jgi:outer membrane protein OmpA-like peptidoglycan-associated protein
MKKLIMTTFAVAFGCGLIATTGCSSAGKNTAIGAGAGGAAGAAVGAVIGHQAGERGKGAVIGGALGAALGGVIGNRLDKQAAELEKVAETKRTEQGIITNLKSDILFDTGKADLKPRAVANVEKLSSIIKKYPENVLTIRGYTDSVGSEQINRELSKRRATSVKSELVAGGVPAETVKVIGMGEQSPVGDNKTKAGRAKNRRVEIEITVDPSKVPKEGV